APAPAVLEKRYPRFAGLCAPLLGETGGPLGGLGFDIGARPEHALWACDELKSTRCFTGKPLHLGGTDYDREGIAGLGVAVAGRTMLNVYGESETQASFAVQGVGAMGAAVLRYFSEIGARLTALGDPRYGGTWIFEQPPSSELRAALGTQEIEKARSLLAAQAKKGSDDPAAVLYSPVDILFPCAVQNAITEDNVERIQARYLCEG